MKTLLICHKDALLEQDGMARWLDSFSELMGIVVLQEKKGRKFKRIKREIKRSGWRFADVMAFRIFYKLFLANEDKEWENRKLSELTNRFPQTNSVPILITHSPNSAETEQFIKEKQPDIVIARCKVILQKKIFSIAKTGTFVMHPGICPEYRNAHGCYWALVNADFEKVGMTLLKIDEGVDTGPTYGYYSYDYDSLNESHIRIQNRVVWENIAGIEEKLKEIFAGKAQPIPVAGRESNVWGHPWLTKYLAWKKRARREGK